VFAASTAGGTEAVDIGRQIGVQVLACAAATAWSALATVVLLKLVDAAVGLRVDEEQETVGLDLSHHEERGYDY
jgi:Amt family ammonium transporter